MSIAVRALGGRLEHVEVVDPAGGRVPGRLTDDGASWSSVGVLGYGSHYTVRARAVNAAGQFTELREAFTTLSPVETLAAPDITPGEGDLVGVGMPIRVRFREPVTRRAEVERRLVVAASRPVEGGWRWVSDREVRWRPRWYWPAYTRVTVTAALRGVEVSEGRWGVGDSTVRFRTGPSMVSRVDAAARVMTVVRAGKLVRRIPVTAGRAGWETRAGIRVITAKHRSKRMDGASVGIDPASPDYYQLQVPYALRISTSGEFLHAAPWSAAAHGRVNVSHGCVGMNQADARWLYEHTLIGDVVVVAHTGRDRLELDNGITDWNVPWSTWSSDNAW